MPRSVLWPDRRVKPPCGAVEIDGGHPLAPDVSYWPVNERAGAIRDLVNRATGALANGASWSPAAGSQHVALAFDGTNDKVTLDTDWIGTRTPLSIVAWIRPTGWGGGSRGRIVANGRFVFFVNNYGSGYTATVAFTSDNSHIAYTAKDSLTLNRWTCAGVYRDNNANSSLYLDGVQSGLANQVSGIPVAGTGALVVGSQWNDDTRAFAGQIGAILAYGRVLTPAEFLWLSADPYCFLRPVQRRRYFFYGAPAGHVYDDDLGLSANAALTPAAQATFGCGLGLDASASMAPGSQASLQSALVLALASALTPQASLDAQASLTLAAQAGFTHAALASLVGQVTLAGQVALTPGAQLVAQCAQSLTARAALTTDSQLLAQCALALLADARLSAGLGNTLEAAIDLAASIGLTAAARADLAGALSLDAQAAITATSQQIAEALLSLGSTASQAHAAQAQLEAALTLSAVAALLQAAASSSDRIPVLIRVISEAFTVAHVTNESFRAASVSAESFGVAHVTNETFT